MSSTTPVERAWLRQAIVDGMVAGGLALAARRCRAANCVPHGSRVLESSGRSGTNRRIWLSVFSSTKDGEHGVEQPILLYVLHKSAALAKISVLTRPKRS